MLPRAKRSFGQNFLVDPTVVEKIIHAAQITAHEAVLEIGAGTGILTAALVAAGARVTAIELDTDLLPALQEQFSDRIRLIHGDALAMEIAPFFEGESSFKVIANIPYNITSPLIEKFLSHVPPPIRMVLMVQKEVADRILARPPDMSVLSVACQLYATCSRVTNVKAGAFRPMPKVDSAVVCFDQIGKRGREEEIIALAKVGFSQRRKQLHNNLLALPHVTASQIKEAIAHVGLAPTIRAENLTIDDWIRLEHQLSTTTTPAPLL